MPHACASRKRTGPALRLRRARGGRRRRVSAPSGGAVQRDGERAEQRAAGGTRAALRALGRRRLRQVAPRGGDLAQRLGDLVRRRRGRLDPPALDLVVPVAEAELEAPVVLLAVLEHPRLERHAEVLAHGPQRRLGIGGEVLVADRHAVVLLARGLERLAVAADQVDVLLRVGVLALVVLARAHDRGRVAQQEDQLRVGPGGLDPVGDEDVVGRLGDEPRLAGAGELALQDAVPQQVLEPLLVEPHLLHRALDPLGVEADGEVAQVDLVRAVDLRVAVEQHAQQRRARAQRAHHEAGLLEQAVAGADLHRARPRRRRRGAARSGAARSPCGAARR